MEDLTPLQLEIICMVANGHTGNQIAKALHRSKPNIDHTIMNARKKVGAKNTAHLLSIVIATGLIEWNSDDNERVVAE